MDSDGVLRPAVAGAAGGGNLLLVSGGAVLLGLVVFLWLSGHRTRAPHDLSTPAPATGAASSALPSSAPPPPEIAALEAASRAGPASPPPPPPILVARPAPLLPSTPPPVVLAPVPVPQGARAPVLVVDLAAPAAAAVATTDTTSKPTGGSGPAVSGRNGGLNGDEQFAARVENAQPDRAHATLLHNQGSIAPQGTVIPAVLETALNSDLPGFARAVVSRDVRSFNGATVLVPRGSRAIGEYHSAASLGQSRAFVIWTRILRPDGVSIQIGSPGTDTLGRAGFAGSVDRHFFERFSGAVLLSVVSAIPAAISGTPSSEVVIGSSQDTTGLASAASAFAPANISPTIKVPQGTPIRIFVARDLDFSSVEDR